MNGAVLLAFVSGVLVIDYLIAVRFLALANRAESDIGAAPATAGRTRPQAARNAATILFITAPMIWLAVAALSFGLVPIDGITPIRFGAGG